jgi:hypothetical protein
MNITITIGVTPQLEKALLGLSSVLGTQVQSAGVKAPEITAAPSQQNIAPVQQVQPNVAPVQQQGVLTSVPTVQEQAPVQQQQAVPTSAPAYSMNQLAVAATQLVDAGKREDLLQLLASFGASALMGLTKEQYGAFATKLREMGAKL